MLQKIREFAKKNRGAVLVEYIIILAFIAALAVAIGLNDDNTSGLRGAATSTASQAKTDLTGALTPQTPAGP